MSVDNLMLLLLTLGLHAVSYGLYSRKVVPAEVAQNAAAITANGSADDLRKGFHQRETWSRVWPWLGFALVSNMPLVKAGISLFALGCLALGLLLAGYFARYFTPLLNLARVAGGRADLSEWHASSDSASWPDAAVYKKARRIYTALSMQSGADQMLRDLLTRTWLYCRLGYGALVVALVLIILL